MIKYLKKNRGFFLFVICLFSARWSIADHYRVPTGSMIPTIEIGDHVFVDKMAYDLKVPFTSYSLKKMKEPKRGDIVVFEFPHDRSINYVKRLIALPGDQVEIKNGHVLINGIPEQGDYEIQRLPQYQQVEELSFTVPKGMYFMMGDNRDMSSDSRSFGFVPRDHLMGKVEGITMSVAFKDWIPQVKFNRFGKIII
ncbi:MAG: signal peptidase I [Halobacteriovoraceae bacterium]|nr:signal peptidase I [Halobacteriovoraceae bacterium]